MNAKQTIFSVGVMTLAALSLVTVSCTDPEYDEQLYFYNSSQK